MSIIEHAAPTPSSKTSLPKPKPAPQKKDAPRARTTPPRAKPKAPPAVPDETVPDEPSAELEPTDEAVGESSGRKALLAVPVSIIFHLLLFIILALITVATPEVREHLFHVANVEEKQEEVLEDFEFDQPEVELQDSTFQPSALDDMGAADFGDVSAPETSVLGDSSAHENVEVDEIGMLFGVEGLGMADVGGGTASTTFFGVETEGQYFMYVVDNSNSMKDGKFENAVVELMDSVEQLPDNAYFYVIFYSDTAYPLFYPNVAPRWVRATNKNKYMLRAWLATVHRCLKTKGEGAMALAMRLRPDVIYLLGDGAFGDDAVGKTLTLKGKVEVTINTLGFNMKPEHAKEFDKLAKAFGGSFRSVQVAPEMKALSAKTNRPRNRTQNGVWGIELGNGKK